MKKQRVDILNSREVVDHLIARAREKDATGRQKVKVRLVIDEFVKGGWGTERGIIWLSDELISKMRGEWIEVQLHSMISNFDMREPMFGNLPRVHRKAMLVDLRRTADRKGYTAAFLGGRVLSSETFSDMRSGSRGCFEDWAGGLIGIGWGPFHDLGFTVAGPIVERIQKTFLHDFEQEGGKIPDDEKAHLLVPQPKQRENLSLRFITHDPGDQNILNVLLYLLKDPHSQQMTFINSYPPMGDLFNQMKLAVRSGKKVKWVIGNLSFYARARKELIPKMIDAGIEVYYVPYQLHTKLYFNDHYYATGNQNMDIHSLFDTEDLTLLPKAHPTVLPLSQYVEQLFQQAHLLNVLEDPQNLSDFSVPDLSSRRIHDEDEHSLVTGIAHLLKFGLGDVPSGLLKRGVIHLFTDKPTPPDKGKPIFRLQRQNTKYFLNVW